MEQRGALKVDGRSRGASLVASIGVKPEGNNVSRRFDGHILNVLKRVLSVTKRGVDVSYLKEVWVLFPEWEEICLRF